MGAERCARSADRVPVRQRGLGSQAVKCSEEQGDVRAGFKLWLIQD